MLIKGKDLTDRQIQQVLSAYIHRNTIEHPYSLGAGFARKTDREYVLEHAFYFTNGGSQLSRTRRYCVPASRRHRLTTGG